MVKHNGLQRHCVGGDDDGDDEHTDWFRNPIGGGGTLVPAGTAMSAGQGRQRLCPPQS